LSSVSITTYKEEHWELGDVEPPTFLSLAFVGFKTLYAQTKSENNT